MHIKQPVIHKFVCNKNEKWKKKQQKYHKMKKKNLCK